MGSLEAQVESLEVQGSVPRETWTQETLASEPPVGVRRTVPTIFIEDIIPINTTGWMDGWMRGWMDGWVDGWMHGWMNGWVDGWMDGWMDGCMGGWMDGWMDGCMGG